MGLIRGFNLEKIKMIEISLSAKYWQIPICVYSPFVIIFLPNFFVSESLIIISHINFVIFSSPSTTNKPVSFFENLSGH